MLEFKRLEGPYGIPVFYQQLPEFVKSTAIALAVFTGSADDTSVGEPGLYHWFEHVPFRGTKKFPGGYEATKGPVDRVSGTVGAYTNTFMTVYEAQLPTRHLAIALDVVTDLVAQPLLTDEAIAAERKIINQEIRDKLGSSGGKMGYTLHTIMWKGHPFGNPTLGSIESLGNMTPALLREAREKGYDRSRMVFFVSSALSASEILAMLPERFSLLPEHGLAERRQAASYGTVPWKPGRYEQESEFSSSQVIVLFPVPIFRRAIDVALRSMLITLFTHGGSSPLKRAVREETQLSYGSGVAQFHSKDGSYLGFRVDTSAENVEAVEEAIRNMFHDPRLRSREHFESILESGYNELDMRILDPEKEIDRAVFQVKNLGETWSEEEGMDLYVSVTQDEVMQALEGLRFEDSFTAVRRGMGKTP